MLSICNGGIFFQEFQVLSATRISLFVLGAFIMLFGMLLLMWHDEEIYEEDLLITVDEEDVLEQDLEYASEQDTQQLGKTKSITR